MLNPSRSQMIGSRSCRKVFLSSNMLILYSSLLTLNQLRCIDAHHFLFRPITHSLPFRSPSSLAESFSFLYSHLGAVRTVFLLEALRRCRTPLPLPRARLLCFDFARKRNDQDGPESLMAFKYSFSLSTETNSFRKQLPFAFRRQLYTLQSQFCFITLL